jgi:phage tail protein X
MVETAAWGGIMMEYYEYTTLQGDTYDSIALDFYNDEAKASIIIQANQAHRKTILFNAGVVLKIPIIEEDQSDSLPPWKKV